LNGKAFKISLQLLNDNIYKRRREIIEENRAVRLFKIGFFGATGWNFLDPETKNCVKDFAFRLGDEFAAYEKRKAQGKCRTDTMT
jgi:hypothetical protein